MRSRQAVRYERKSVSKTGCPKVVPIRDENVRDGNTPVTRHRRRIFRPVKLTLLGRARQEHVVTGRGRVPAFSEVLHHELNDVPGASFSSNTSHDASRMPQ